MDRATIIAKLDEVKVLIRNGWTKGAFKDGHSYCLLGAVRQVNGADFCIYRVSTWPLVKAIARKTHKHHSVVSITGYNDAPTRTKKQILDVIELAKKYA